MLIERFLAEESDTVRIASLLVQILRDGGVVFLEGELGAGKTTGLGYEGAVKSPTFTLVEPYTVNGQQIFHFDLYRLNDPGELEYVGVDDYFDRQHLCLVEWPERGADFLPSNDLTVRLGVEGLGRRLVIEANSDYGERVVQQLVQRLSQELNN